MSTFNRLALALTLAIVSTRVGADGIPSLGTQSVGNMNREGIVNVGVAPGILDNVAGLTLAVSMSRKLVSTYSGAFFTATTGSIDAWKNQTSAGATNDLVATTTARPTAATGGPNNIAAASFDGTTDYIHHATLPISSLFSATTGWVITCFVANTVAANNANPYDNAPVFGDAGNAMGVYLKNTGAPRSGIAYNNDGTQDVATSATITPGTAYVIEWVHTGGNVVLYINGTSVATTASGNTTPVTGVLGFGHGSTSSVVFLDGLIFEAATASAVPANRDVIASNFMTQCGASVACSNSFDFSQACNSQYLGAL